MNDEIIEVAISDIKTTGRRFRKDHGDVEALARLIEQGDLLQPIGVTDGLELVFGERRLRAYRDVLKRNTIPARFVNPASVELAQIDENVCRKDFTISEKVEIVDFLRGYRHGGNRKPGQEGNCAVELLTVDQAAKRAGLKNRDAYNRAKRVVQKGVPELVKAMDDEEISISAAADLASLDDELQRTLLAERTDWTANEITSMSGRTETTVAGNGDDAPTAEDSGEVGAEPEGEPGVPSEFVPVVGRGQDELDGTSADSTGESDGPLDNELDEPTEAEGGDPYNFYPTPPPVTEALLEVEDFGSQVWEPACGDGAISERSASTVMKWRRQTSWTVATARSKTSSRATAPPRASSPTRTTTTRSSSSARHWSGQRTRWPCYYRWPSSPAVEGTTCSAAVR